MSSVFESASPRTPKLRALLHELENLIQGHTDGAPRTRGIMVCRQIELVVQDQDIEIDKATIQRSISSAEKLKLSQVVMRAW